MRGPIPIRLPHTPGIDLAGTVDALGEDVTGLGIGDRVIGALPLTSTGAAAEYVIAPAGLLAAAPTSVPLVDAAGLPLVGLTAWQALFDHAKLTTGQRVLNRRWRRYMTAALDRCVDVIEAGGEPPGSGAEAG